MEQGGLVFHSVVINTFNPNSFKPGRNTDFENGSKTLASLSYVFKRKHTK